MGKERNIRPNKPELLLESILNAHWPDQWKYTGDFSFVINGKNPDFIKEDMKMKATFIKDLNGFTGTAKLYKVDPPMKYDEPFDDDDPPAKETNFVVVSAVSVFGMPETYIFPSDEDGEIIDWGELDGSFKGALNHERALKNAGYEVN